MNIPPKPVRQTATSETPVRPHLPQPVSPGAVMTFICGGTTVEAECSFGGAARAVNCRSWSCETCAPARARQLQAEARSGKPNRFITLTSRRKPGYSAIQAARALVSAWRIIVRLVRKQHPGKEVEYFPVFEATKSGWPHLHILYRGPWISQHWLSAQMRRLTNSPIVDIRHVDNAAQAVAYVAKYVGQEPHKFGTLKRYWKSGGWALPDDEVWERAIPKGAPWTLRDFPIKTIREDWVRWGRSIIDLGSGMIGWGALCWDWSQVRAPPHATRVSRAPMARGGGQRV